MTFIYRALRICWHYWELGPKGSSTLNLAGPDSAVTVPGEFELCTETPWAAIICACLVAALLAYLPLQRCFRRVHRARTPASHTPEHTRSRGSSSDFGFPLRVNDGDTP